MDQAQQNFEVRYCSTNELRTELDTFLYDLATKNGWPAAYGHAQFASLIDPNGNIVGLLDKQIVTVISAVNYNENFCFIGTFMTLDEHQKKGFGTKVFNECLKHAGNRVTGLYAASHMTEWYKKQGFEVTGTASIYRFHNPGKFSFPQGFDPSVIVPLKDVSFDDLCRFDRKYFPVERREFLHAWLTHPKIATVFVYFKEGVIHGYGAIRLCMGDKMCKFGPLFGDSLEVAQCLAVALLNGLPEGMEMVQLETLDDNEQSKVLAGKLGFTETEYGGMVMHKNGRLEFDVSGVYGYTSGAYG